MRILLVNPPHPAIGSRIPQEHLPPLGLLALGGPLHDAGHQVKLLDAEFGPMPVEHIIAEVRAYNPDSVLLGHSGSTSGHPVAARIARAVRAAMPDVWIVYGGVFATFHWAQIMEQEPGIDFIVRGEGEETVVRLITALEGQQPLTSVPGIVFRAGTVPGSRRSGEPRPTGSAGLSAGVLQLIRVLTHMRRQGVGFVAKRLECGQLAAAFDSPRERESGSKLTALQTLRDAASALLPHAGENRDSSRCWGGRSTVPPHRAGGDAGAPGEAAAVEPVLANPTAPLIRDLDGCRVGWELIDHRRYSYWGNRRAVVVQFSRGCPHQCAYCGQRDFWRSWRHRDPVKFAAELARLHREQGVEVINFADENPTASRPAWQAFLEALIAENVPLILVGSTRASDIVRDADILHLYKRAGVARLLLGIESTDEKTLTAIRKGSTQAIDREAIRLLREHGIISMAAWVAGFVRERDRDYWRLLRQILSYDPDQIQALYATPHRWTPFAQQAARHRVIQTDLGRWDYKHQVLESRYVPNWRVLGWMKLIEAVSQLRPKSLLRLLAHPDPGFRAAMRWYYSIGRRVWPYELWHWLFRDRRTAQGPAVAEFLNGGWKETGLTEANEGNQEGGKGTRRPLREALGEASAWGLKAWPVGVRLLFSPRLDKGESAVVSDKTKQPYGL